MSDEKLNQAIQLIQQGKSEQARLILETLIQLNQQDLTAWSWYVKSCSTPETRLAALKVCLHFNPDNPQIIDAIQKLQGKLTPNPNPSVEFARGPSLLSTAEPAARTLVKLPEGHRTMEAFSEPLKFISLDEVSGRPFAWYAVWWNAVTKPNPYAYTALLRDPLANPVRAYGWVFLAVIIIVLISVANPNAIGNLSNIGVFGSENIIPALILIGSIVVLITGIIWGFILLTSSAVINNLIAKAFGGSGDFSRTVYLIGAYSAPLSIIIGILAFIPIVNYLIALLAIYAFILNLTAIQAAQRLNVPNAFWVGILSVLLMGLIGIIVTQIFPFVLLPFNIMGFINTFYSVQFK